MLGIESPGVYWAYIGSIISALACVIYGILNWNKGYIDDQEAEKSQEWQEHEKDITDSL